MLNKICDWFPAGQNRNQHENWKSQTILKTFYFEFLVFYSFLTCDCVSGSQLIIKGQDEQLDKIGTSVGVLKNMSHQIGNELEEQNRWAYWEII